jgi:serine/threonine-protein kinase
LRENSDFGPYHIIGPLGKGGMASVYKAYEAGLDRYVALKVLPAGFLHDDGFSERFRREAKVIARLEHPHIVPIHAFGIDEGTPWMAMRLISGGTVASELSAGPMARARAVRILEDVAEALDYAHAKGIVHRDVKPPNIHNVSEWCSDRYGSKVYAGATAADSSGPSGGTERVLRGGALNSKGKGLRVSLRNHLVPVSRSIFVGLRCARGGEDLSRSTEPSPRP